MWFITKSLNSLTQNFAITFEAHFLDNDFSHIQRNLVINAAVSGSQPIADAETLHQSQ